MPVPRTDQARPGVTFSGELRFLSNFWPCTVYLGNDDYPSVEHAYQAAKTLDHNERREIRFAPTPRIAKRLGSQVTKRPGWDSMKIEIMEHLVRQKFKSSDELRNLLLSTGNMILEEGNTWGDTFWGVCNGSGRNELGKILMKVRDELR